LFNPFRLLDPSGEDVASAAMFFADLLAAGRSAGTVRSYGMDLLRWFRFLWAVQVSWDRASRLDARDFTRWLMVVAKPGQRRVGGGVVAPRARGGLNAVTGIPLMGDGYAARTIVHSESVLRTFYDFHRDFGVGPIVNPFPQGRSGRHGAAISARSRVPPFGVRGLAGIGRRCRGRFPRSIPDELFNEIFARLPSNRDRALVTFWVSTGARASELLGVLERDADPGRQVVAVVRKGSRAVHEVPASPDAFVWLALYQHDLRGRIRRGPAQPLWRSLRRPHGALAYHAAYRMFARVNASLGANWSLHALRHTAAHRMVDA
jgi:integrase